MRIFALVALTFLLVGCVPAEPAVTPVPVSSTKPLFASDADALKAATDAYAAYTAQGDLISSGQADPETMRAFVSPSQLKDEQSVFDRYKARGYTTRGSTGIDSITLENYSDRTSDSFQLSMYVCLVLAQIRLIDSTGSDVTPASVLDKTPLEIEFVRGHKGEKPLLIDRSEAWSGKNYCR